jgi:hypothetical protein
LFLGGFRSLSADLFCLGFEALLERLLGPFETGVFASFDLLRDAGKFRSVDWLSAPRTFFGRLLNRDRMPVCVLPGRAVVGVF